MKKPLTGLKVKGRLKQEYPRGWNEKRVREVIAYYDRQTEDEEAAEFEAAMTVNGRSVILVPTELVPEIRRFIRNRHGR